METQLLLITKATVRPAKFTVGHHKAACNGTQIFSLTPPSGIFTLRVDSSQPQSSKIAPPMKTSHTQGERRQTIPQAEINNHGFSATAFGALLLFVAMAAPALAVDAIWQPEPNGNGDWNLATNWQNG